MSAQNAPPPVEPVGMFHGLHWRAIAYGAILDLALTFLLVIPLYIGFAGTEVFATDDNVANQAMASAHQSVPFNLLVLFVGGLCTVFGAFKGASRAGEQFTKHGGWVGVVAVIIALLFMLLSSDAGSGRQPVWVEVAAFGMVVPAGILGGHIAALRRSRAA